MHAYLATLTPTNCSKYRYIWIGNGTVWRLKLTDGYNPLNYIELWHLYIPVRLFYLILYAWKLVRLANMNLMNSLQDSVSLVDQIDIVFDMMKIDVFWECLKIWKRSISLYNNIYLFETRGILESISEIPEGSWFASQKERRWLGYVWEKFPNVRALPGPVKDSKIIILRQKRARRTGRLRRA